MNTNNWHTDTFKGIPALTIENDSIRCTILPSYGGKMVRLFDKDAQYEWLYQAPGLSLEIPEYGADFSKFDSSGFDEMFPGIDQGPHPASWKEIPDHGEVWTLPWEVSEDNGRLHLKVESPVFPYTLSKNLILEGASVRIEYQAENHSEVDFPFIWTPHALLNIDETTRIAVPEDMDQVINVEHQTRHLGKWGTHHNYPITTSMSTNDKLDLSKLEPLDDGTVEKFYFTEPLSEGWCGLVQPNIGRKLTYHFPQEKVPYLGVWKTRGGYRGDYNVALEPCTGMYDDVYVAEKIGRGSRIPANGVYNWNFTMEIGKI